MKEISPLFEGVYDPRRSNAPRYESTLSGGETCSDMALYGRPNDRDKYLLSDLLHIQRLSFDREPQNMNRFRRLSR